MSWGSSFKSRYTQKDWLHELQGFIKYTTRICEAINKQIDDIQTYADGEYERYRRIYKYGQDWDEQATIRAEQHRFLFHREWKETNCRRVKNGWVGTR